MKKNFLFILFTFFIIKINAQTTWLVTTTADAGAGSLRNAVAKAGGGDTIRIDPATFKGGGVQTITLTSGEIAFTTDYLVFKGFYNANGDTVKVSGNNASRVFDIINVDYNVLDSMVIVNGNSTGNGGAIMVTGYNSDSVLISSSFIYNSTSSGSYGGGGVFADSNVTNLRVVNSTIDNNSTIDDFGGGIFASNNLTVNNSTIAGNSAWYAGGGIFAGKSVTITTCTIAGNTALNSGGGGIASGAVTIINSTIVGNTIGISGYGGGIYASPIMATSSIVANNTGGDMFDYNIGYSNITSGGYNIFSDVPAGSVSTDQIGLGASCLQLGPLQNNGGSTFTMLPLAGSAAINQGNPADNSFAQNGIAPHGIRDVGAAESMLDNSIFFDTVSTSCSSYLFGDSVYTNSGDYMDTLYSSGGCDSIVSLHLILLPVTITHDTVTVATNCTGYTFGDSTYFYSGDYKDTLYSTGGCDSNIVELHLTIPPVLITYDTVISTACQAPYYFDGNHTYSASGDYMDTLTSVSGCDSILSLHYVIEPGKSDIVTTLADDGPGSLRATIASACYLDTIRFAPGLISGGSATIVLTSGPLAFGTNLVFKGLYNSKGDTLYISGNNASNIFNITSPTYLELDSMVLINGNTSDDGGAINMGGALTGNLVINNCVIRNNTTTSTFNGGGAIYTSNYVASVIINNSVISGNSAVGSSGGGVLSRGNVIINGCTISNNFATYGGGGVIASNNLVVGNSTITNNSVPLIDGSFALEGGGVSANNVTVTNSTISNNAASYAAGINAYNAATVINSTINNNSAIAVTAIFANYETITNSTITNNLASNGNSVTNAGSIQITNSTIVNNAGTNYSITADTITIASSIVAFNVGGNIYDYSILEKPSIISNGYNIFADTTVVGSVCSDQTGITAKQLNLGPLQNNGGTTSTILPGAGSVAIDRGNPADNSIAQNNVAPHGIRDAGAAESMFTAISSLNSSLTATTGCGADTLHITSSTNATWSSAAILYSNNIGTLYDNSATNSIYVKADNNAYVLANFGNSTCPLGIDSILVTVTNSSSNLATATTTDSSVLVGPTQINDANCQVIALVTPAGTNPVSGSVTVTDSIGTAVSSFYGNPYLSRVYDITPSQNASNATATITLYYTDAEMQAYNTYISANGLTATIPDAPTITMPADTAAAKATFRIIQYHGLFASPYNDTNGVVIPITSMFYNSAVSAWEVTFNVTGFSGFYAYTNKTGLPLALVWQYITAIENGSNNEITWKVYNSNNGGIFEVQSSVNGQSFTTIASIPYSNTQVVYSAEDVNPPAQVYYRVKYTDKDGTVYYSAIKMINRQQANVFAVTNIYPLPAKNNLVVETYSPIATTITYTIADATGQVIRTEQHGAMQSAKQLLDISNLSNGIYLIKITDALGNTATRKFPKL